MLHAKLGNQQATCPLTIHGKEIPQGGVTIRLVEKDLGIYRAQFNRENPNLLEITTSHESVGRYLRRDESGDRYDGQDSPHFRILMAEIVAETIARRVIIAASEDGSRFASTAHQTNAQYEIFNKLLPRAHRIMVPSAEAASLLSERS